MAYCYVVETFDGDCGRIQGVFNELKAAKEYVKKLILNSSSFSNTPYIEFWRNQKQVKTIEFDSGKWVKVKY